MSSSSPSKCKPKLPQLAGSAEPESRKPGTSRATNNIWKMFLLFVAVGLLNTVYVTKFVLRPEEENQRHDLELYDSFTEEGSTNSTDAIMQDFFVKLRAQNDTKGHQFSFASQNEDAPNHVRVKAHKNIDTTTNVTTATGTDKEEAEVKYIPRVPTKKKRRENEKNKKGGRRRHKKHQNKTYSPEQKEKWKVKETTPMSNISNAIFYKDIPQEFLVEDPSAFVWDRPELMIPEWLKDYFRWHRWKRSTWNDAAEKGDSSWMNSERWMISQCLLSQDKRKCGGTADRLKPIPILLRVAYENKRVFLIRWTRPAPLEEFLLPPKGGFDWRIPPALEEYVENKKKGKRLTTRALILEYAATGLSFMRARYQTGQPADSYNKLVFNPNSTEIGALDDQDEFGFENLFSRVWRVCFTPSPPIQDILKSRLSSLGLVPNEYVASHLRALYATDERPIEEIHRFTENALACATKIYPGVPIFFASDAGQALEYAQGYNGKEVYDINKQSIKLKVLTAGDSVLSPSSAETAKNDNKNASAIPHPWHLDSYIGPVENFYDTFVDIYMLAMAGCVTYGKGGYGHWGMLIGGHIKCQSRQVFIGRRRANSKGFCKFTSTTESFENITTTFHNNHPSVFGNGDPQSGPIFLPPVE